MYMCIYKQMVCVYTHHFTGDCYKFLAHFGGPFFPPLGVDPEFRISSKNLVWIIRILIKDFVSVITLPFRLQSSKTVTFWLLGKSCLPSQKIQLMFFFNRLLMFEAG